MSADDVLVHVHDDDLERILESDSRPMLLEFTAAWCGPCKPMGPRVNAFAHRHRDLVRFGIVDGDSCPQTMTRFGVLGFPTLILVSSRGTEVMVAGGRDAQQLESELLPYLCKLPSGPAMAPPMPASLRTERTVTVTGADGVSVSLVGSDQRELDVGTHTVPAEYSIRVILRAAEGGGPLTLAPLSGWEATIDLLFIAGDLEGDEFEALARCSELSSLGLVRERPLQSSELEALARMKSLRHLIARGLIDEAAERLLAEALPSCSINGRWVSAAALREAGPLPPDVASGPAEPFLRTTLHVGTQSTTFILNVPEGGYVYGPGATDGQPLRLRSLGDGAWIELEEGDVHLTGTVEFSLNRTDLTNGIAVEVQFCTEEQCFMPQELWCLPTEAP